MISIARHIELLLLEHDCVIVPNFGGFIASHNFAQYHGDDEKAFLPPYRTIAFNDKLTINDGLLVQSYMSAYDASYPAACLQMEKDVERMMEQLDEKGEFVLDGVGTLNKMMNKGITFTSFESGVVTPRLYGLYSFEIHSLDDVKAESELNKALNIAEYTTVKVEGENIEERKGETGRGENKNFIHTILRSHWIEVASSAAAAAVVFAVFMLPHNKRSQADELVVASTYTSPINNVANVENKAKAENTLEMKGAEEQSADVAEKNEDKVEKKDEKVEGEYTLVMASYVTERNANTFITGLKKEGFDEGRFVRKGKVNRILYSNYKTEKEAFDALYELRRQSPSFADAWVMKQ